MMPGYRTGTAPGSGCGRIGQLHWLAMAAILAIVLSPVGGVVWTHGVSVARAQDEIAGGDATLPGQVIAQGIARLPRGDVAWTVRSIEVPGGEGTPVASFPIGFAVADGGTIAVLNAKGEVLNLLQDGEAAFLPTGSAGALVSGEDDEARLYEIALVSGQEVSAGETPGTVVGNPFAAPNGAAFDIEIARAMLARDDQTTIPVSRSGTPVLYLQTAGAAQLQAGGGQAVELATGQFAMLQGEVSVRGASDEPATFLVAAVGQATAKRDATEDTPQAGASRKDRQKTRDAATASDKAPRAKGTREKRAKPARTGGGGAGQGPQTAPQDTGGAGTAPVTGAVTPTPSLGASAGTPPMEPAVEATLPGETTIPDEGTPPPDATLPTEDEAPADATETPDTAELPGDTIPTEEPAAGESLPTVEAPPAEEALPTEEMPAEEPPAAEEPVVEPTPEA